MATNIPSCYDKTRNLVQEKQELYTVFDICLQTKAVLKKNEIYLELKENVREDGLITQ